MTKVNRKKNNLPSLLSGTCFFWQMNKAAEAPSIFLPPLSPHINTVAGARGPSAPPPFSLPWLHCYMAILHLYSFLTDRCVSLQTLMTVPQAHVKIMVPVLMDTILSPVFVQLVGREAHAMKVRKCTYTSVLLHFCLVVPVFISKWTKYELY